jgi:hypothetical protein
VSVRCAWSLCMTGGVFVLSMACAPATAEEQLLSKFFQAARTLDSSVTTQFSTIGFNPRTEGSVQGFVVTAIGHEQAKSRGVEKDVTIKAAVRSPDGRISSRTLIMTLQRSAVPGPGPTAEGRWMITALRQAPASRTSRATSSVPPSCSGRRAWCRR